MFYAEVKFLTQKYLHFAGGYEVCHTNLLPREQTLSWDPDLPKFDRLNSCLYLDGSCFSMNELQKLANYALHEANQNCSKTFKVDYV